MGTDLTPLGAQTIGNADGTIPSWTGGITEPPAGYEQGKNHIDPFSDDKILLTITNENVGTYKKNLTEGSLRYLNSMHQALR